MNRRALLRATDTPVPHVGDSNADESIGWEGEAPAEPKCHMPVTG